MNDNAVSAPGTESLVAWSPEQIAQEFSLKPFQGKQLFQWIHQKRVFDFDKMTNLSKKLRETLAKRWPTALSTTMVNAVESPGSGARKVVLALDDGETVESVLLRQQDRITLCLSSQAGCPVGCPFCATGLSGFRRNLNAGEIVEQALYLLQDEELRGKTPNIVYMGMGEPFLNYDEVVRSIRILMEPEGLGIGARKITVSTVGHVPGIRLFASENWQVRLSVSLHAANDTLRSKLVPMNRNYRLGKLLHALRNYMDHAGRQLTIEWTLLGGVNDSPKDAQELADWMRPLKACVNAIPYNPVSDAAFSAPAPERCNAFCETLRSRGVSVTLRRERGQDIEAACGQLRRSHQAQADEAPNP